MSTSPAQDKDVTFGEARAGIDLVPRMLRTGAAGGGVVWSMGAASCVVLARTVEDGLAARSLLDRAEAVEARATALLLKAADLSERTQAEMRRSALAICALAVVSWLWAVLS